MRLETILENMRKSVDRNGLKALLPQNLSEDALERMLVEAEALENEKSDKTPATAFLFAILQLTARKSMNSGMKIEMDEITLMKNFQTYTGSIRLEKLRREGVLHIPDEELPTIETLFK